MEQKSLFSYKNSGIHPWKERIFKKLMENVYYEKLCIGFDEFLRTGSGKPEELSFHFQIFYTTFL